MRHVRRWPCPFSMLPLVCVAFSVCCLSACLVCCSSQAIAVCKDVLCVHDLLNHSGANRSQRYMACMGRYTKDGSQRSDDEQQRRAQECDRCSNTSARQLGGGTRQQIHAARQKAAHVRSQNRKKPPPPPPLLPPPPPSISSAVWSPGVERSRTWRMKRGAVSTLVPPRNTSLPSRALVR